MPSRVEESMDTFAFDDESIPVERFAPAGAARFPALVLLHGADALTFMGDAYREMAREFARHGYGVFLPHYFGRRTSRPTWPIRPLEFAAWMQAVGESLTYAAGQPGVDPARIALVGFSLGAYLALAVAAHDPRVAAVIECCGGLPDVLAEGLVRMPPTLILHGENDWVVPVREAHKLERLLRDRGLPHAIKTYPGQGHNLLGAVYRDAFRRALDFLEAHVPQGAAAP